MVNIFIHRQTTNGALRLDHKKAQKKGEREKNIYIYI